MAPSTSLSPAPGLMPVSDIRGFLLNRGSSSVADKTFSWLMLGCAATIFGIVALIAGELISKSELSWKQFGLPFFYKYNVDPNTHLPLFWDPVNGTFFALPFLYGTLVTSLVALAIAVPLAIGVAVFLTEMSPRWMRAPLSFLTELLAAIPSVVYGLWAIFVLVPLLREHVNPVFMAIFNNAGVVKVLGWTGLVGDAGLFGGVNLGLGYFGSGAILAIMILPIIASLTREVMSAVPHSQREAALALGATRWEMIRIAVLRNARIGIVGSIILGLGRALGETMAVAMVIGNTPEIHKSLLATGHSMASVIANEFSEATSDMHRSALIEIGLALFVVTIIVNGFARFLVWAVTRGTPARVV
ncbi:MAG TPA: phosphate ABC transporter permease subunit PstC [Acidobacteriaceae bacterium]